jgi:negative regulator of replication initiation
MSERLPAVAFKADEEIMRILALLEQHEERTRSDVIRRALRFHAEHLGLIKPKAKRSTPAKAKPRAIASNARARHGA